MAALDTFPNLGPHSEAAMWPASGVEAVTPHDTNELTVVSRALWVGSAGDLAVLMVDGTTATFVGIPAGTLMPLRVRRVNSTDTTASSIVSLY